MEKQPNPKPSPFIPGSLDHTGRRGIRFADLAELNIKPRQILFKCDVLHCGWELDSQAWLLEDIDGRRHILTTDHGHWVIVDPSYLTERISYYSSVLQDTKTLLEKSEA